MSKIEVNTVEPQCGTTLTLGGCGQTVALGTGASQTGFGRTGTVDWETTPKTGTFTAVSGKGYFANTTASAFTMNLPAGSAGDIVSVMDYAGTWQTYNLTVAANGTEKIGGVASAPVALSTQGQSVTFVYVDSTQGWLNTMDSTSNVRGNAYIVATGGCITTSGNDKIHTFTGPGTFTVSCTAVCAANNLVSYLVIAGGGGTAGDRGGGGGAGGYRELKSPSTPYTASPLDGYPSAPNRITVTATGYPITVGAGGATDNTPPYSDGTQGATSTFSSISSAGGGAGHRSTSPGGNGGSGGGAGSIAPHTGRPGGSGNTPPTTPAQGQDGGDSANSSPGYATGGGGGAGGAGGDGSGPCAGDGGAGVTSSINGTPTARAGGGGGGSDNSGDGGTGGTGGGGNGGGGTGPGSPNPAQGGSTNTGGGAGGTSGGGPGVTSGNGGSGLVIIRYKYQ